MHKSSLTYINSSIQLRGSGTFLRKKITQEKLTKFTKILSNIRSSCITFFVPKCLDIPIIYISHYICHVLIHNSFVSKCWDIPIIYFLQEKSTHYLQRVLTNFGLGILAQFEFKKIIQEKSIITSIFNYIMSSWMIFRAKMSGSQIIYCLQEESKSFWVKN